ncbi:MAG TPA: bestrophin family ion channel [Planctomycetaceae bacterium]|nr:bestrophin family ion channel [Planctomycetaceae bacterium]
MIVKENPTWFRLLFSFRGSGLANTWWRLAVVTALSVVVTAVYVHYDATGTDDERRRFPLSLSLAPFAVVGVALSIFLGFRNNASYERYWEGRRLWGQLVNAARTFARQTTTLAVPPLAGAGVGSPAAADVAAFQRGVVLRTIAFAHALRHHLRDTDPLAELDALLPPAETAELAGQRNIPLAVLQSLGRQVQAAWRRGWIREYHVPVFEASLTELTAIQGGCERIKNTPLPFAYSVLLHQLVAFYCLLLPFGIVQEVGVMTPLVVLLISHAFLGLDELGDEIEEPFGTHPNDLPLSGLSRAIEINLRQLLGERDVPEFLRPVRNVLT